MSIDLALVFPRIGGSGDPPLGVASIAAYVRSKGYRVAIVDGTWQRDCKAVATEVQRLDPAVVGYYTATMTMPNASRISGWLNVLDDTAGRKRTILAGGPHVTVRPEDGRFLQADHVIQGEGEYAVADILAGRTPSKEKPDLATLPAPALDLLDVKRYIDHWHYAEAAVPGVRGTNVCGSRGCPFSCTFCANTLKSLFGKKVRYRPAALVVEEVAKLHRDYGIRAIMLHDDTATANKRWLTEFGEAIWHLPEPIFWFLNSRCDTLDEETVQFMAQHYCRGVHLGVEAASDRIRNGLYEKNISLEQVREAVRLCRRHRLHVGAFFMLNGPGETVEEMQATVDLACSLPLDEASFSLTVPLPGTALYDRMKADGCAMSADFNRYNYYADQPYGNVQAAKKIQNQALWRFYSHRPGYVLRHFTSVRGVRRLLDKVGRFRS